MQNRAIYGPYRLYIYMCVCVCLVLDLKVREMFEKALKLHGYLLE